MLRMCAIVASGVIAIGLTVNLAEAGMTKHNAIAGQKALCHSKIDPKHLTGDASKAEWKKCMESPDYYK